MNNPKRAELTSASIEVMEKRRWVESSQFPSKAERDLNYCARCGGECVLTPRYMRPRIEGTRIKLEVCPERFKAGVKLLEWTAIPERYAGKTFADYEVTADNERAVKLAKWFLSKGERGLYLYGAPGTGKTFLASLIAQEYVLMRRTVEFGDVPQLLNELKRGFDTKTAAAIYDRYCQRGLLVLDDLGAGKVSDWYVETIYRLINERYNRGRLIIVTSNYDLPTLESVLSKGDKYGGERIVSRLREMCVQGFLGVKDRRRR